MADESIHELTAAYTLDALDERDQAAYEDHLAGCDRCREDLASLSEAAVALAYGVEAPPPPQHLRGRILEAAAADRSNVVPLFRRTAFQAAAAVAAVAACLAIAFGVWAASLHRSLDRERSASASQSAAMDILADPASRRVPLGGIPGTLVVDPRGRGALVVDSLPSAPSGHTYEAWIIGRGAPKPAGLFRGGGLTVFPLRRTLPKGVVVGVTVERSGGADAPTGAPIIRARV